MRLLATVGLLALAAPAGAQHSSAPPVPSAPGPASEQAFEQAFEQVRVTARIVVVDRDAFTRAGLSYLVIGNDRVSVRSTRPGGARGVRVAVGTHGISAFLDAVRRSRWVRSESTQQVLTLSGAEAVISSSQLSVGRHAARTRGPSLAVLPTVLADGSVHLRVSARLEDEVSYAWGYRVDGSPAAVDTEVIARDGEEVLLASSSAVQSTRDVGMLSLGVGEQGRDVLISVSATAANPLVPAPRRPGQQN